MHLLKMALKAMNKYKEVYFDEKDNGDTLLQWKPRNVITVNVMSFLLSSHFIGTIDYRLLYKNNRLLLSFH
jgi:hypothetical protein